MFKINRRIFSRVLSTKNFSSTPDLFVRDIFLPRNVCAVDKNSSLFKAMNLLVQDKLSAGLVVSADNHIEGLFTSRDILRYISKEIHATNKSAQDLLNCTSVEAIMTPRDRLVYCAMEDSIKKCREIMFKCHVNHLPVLDQGVVQGIVSHSQLAHSSFQIFGIPEDDLDDFEKSRIGLPSSTLLSISNIPILTIEPPSILYNLEVGTFSCPHPYKKFSSAPKPFWTPSTDNNEPVDPNSLGQIRSSGKIDWTKIPTQLVSPSRRDYGALDIASSPWLSEDAHFAIRVPLAGNSSFNKNDQAKIDNYTLFNEVTGNHSILRKGRLPLSPDDFSSLPLSHIYIGMCDGVGGWRKHGLDPRQFSYSLVNEAINYIEEMHNEPYDPAIHPLKPSDIMLKSWLEVKKDEINGSSTMCIGCLDPIGRFSYANLGDTAVVVIRRQDSNATGTMVANIENLNYPQASGSSIVESLSNYSVSFLSRQQVKSFNLPYQLGFINQIKDSSYNFETPGDADVGMISVIEGDIIIFASDGFFDNIDINLLLEEILDWENSSDTIKSKIESNTPLGEVELETLAKRLVERSRELSLDTSRDSPFALLAKENDIMWGGGAPDDISLIIARVITP